MLAAIQGFICGILLAIICQAVLLYRFVLSLQSDRLFPATNGDAKRATPAADHPEALAPWPEQIVSQIKAALEPSSLDSQQQEAWPQAMSPTIEADWVNVYLCRYFLALRSSSIFREKWAAIMCRSINLKLKGNSFVSRVDIADLYLGDNAPTITGLRLAKGATEDLALEMHGDVIYLGGASLKVVVNMSSGSQVPIQVYISAFSGTVCVL